MPNGLEEQREKFRLMGLTPAARALRWNDC